MNITTFLNRILFCFIITTPAIYKFSSTLTYILEPTSWASCLTRLLASKYSIIAVYIIYCLTTMWIQIHVFTRKKESVKCIFDVCCANKHMSSYLSCVDIIGLQRHLLIWISIKWIMHSAYIKFFHLQFLCLYEWHHTSYRYKMFSKNHASETTDMTYIRIAYIVISSYWTYIWMNIWIMCARICFIIRALLVQKTNLSGTCLYCKSL